MSPEYIIMVIMAFLGVLAALLSYNFGELHGYLEGYNDGLSKSKLKI